MSQTPPTAGDPATTPFTPPYVVSRTEACPECEERFEVDANGMFVSHRIAFDGEPCSTAAIVTDRVAAGILLLDSRLDAARGDETAEIALAAENALHKIVDLFGVEAIDWIRTELISSMPRSFTDRYGDIWIEGTDGLLSMLFAPAGTFQDWPFEAVECVHGPLTQVSGPPAPVVHATSRWQRVLGRLGIPTPTLCNKWIVARPASGAARKCRECER